MASQTLPVCHLQNSERYLAARCLTSTIDFCFVFFLPHLPYPTSSSGAFFFFNNILGYNWKPKEHKAWGGRPEEGNKPEACQSLCALGVLLYYMALVVVVFFKLTCIINATAALQRPCTLLLIPSYDF